MLKKFMNKVNEGIIGAGLKTKSLVRGQKGEIPYWVNAGIVILITVAIGFIVWPFIRDNLLQGDGGLINRVQTFWNDLLQ